MDRAGMSIFGIGVRGLRCNPCSESLHPRRFKGRAGGARGDLAGAVGLRQGQDRAPPRVQAFIMRGPAFCGGCMYALPRILHRGAGAGVHGPCVVNANWALLRVRWREGAIL